MKESHPSADVNLSKKNVDVLLYIDVVEARVGEGGSLSSLNESSQCRGGEVERGKGKTAVGEDVMGDTV